MLVADQITCIVQAAERYGVPANVMLAVAEKEGGLVGQYVPNRNGTYDVGPMQFNTGYLRSLEQYGITPGDVAASGCYPYELAAWRIKGHIGNDDGDLWTKAANYHSRTPYFNAIYRNDLEIKGRKWLEWLKTRYVLDVKPASGRTMANQIKRRPVVSMTVDRRMSTYYVPRLIWAK